MFSPITNKIYYIGNKVRDKKSGKEGIIYQINVLGSSGIRVKFDDNTKKGFFSNQLLNLDIIS